MPRCNTCGLEKNAAEFPKNGVDKDGKTRRRPDCNVCYTIKRKLDKTKHTKFVNNTKHRTGEQDTYTLNDWKDVLIFFGGRCAYCGRPQSRRMKLTREHVLAVSTGGPTVRSNIVPGCVSCNSSKANTPVDEWYTKQGFYREERYKKIKEWMKQDVNVCDKGN